MAIQSFGMSMGALRWTDRLLHQPEPKPLEAEVRPRDFALVVAGVLALSVPGMLLTQRLGSFDQHAVLLGYKAFSILLGTALIAATWTVNARRAERDRLAPRDLAMLAAIGLVGGPITALFSVGVGELVALYLFIRHYPVLLCTGAACVISAISVIAGSVWHIEAGTMSSPGQPFSGGRAAPKEQPPRKLSGDRDRARRRHSGKRSARSTIGGGTTEGVSAQGCAARQSLRYPDRGGMDPYARRPGVRHACGA